MKSFIFFALIIGAQLIAFILGQENGLRRCKSNTPSLKEYQIRIEYDTAYLYDGGRLVGSAPHGSDGIDSLILKDNL